MILPTLSAFFKFAIHFGISLINHDLKHVDVAGLKLELRVRSESYDICDVICDPKSLLESKDK